MDKADKMGQLLLEYNNLHEVLESLICSIFFILFLWSCKNLVLGCHVQSCQIDIILKFPDVDHAEVKAKYWQCQRYS